MENNKSINALAKFTDELKNRSCVALIDSPLIDEMEAKELRRIIHHLLVSISNNCQDCCVPNGNCTIVDAAVELEEEYGWEY